MAENHQKLVNVQPQTWERLGQGGLESALYQRHSSKRCLERRDGNSFGASLWLVIPSVLIFIALFNLTTRSRSASELPLHDDRAVEPNLLAVAAPARNATTVSDEPSVVSSVPQVADVSPELPSVPSESVPLSANEPSQMPELKTSAGLKTEQFNDAIISLKNKWEQMPEYFRRKCLTANTVPDLMRCIVQQQQDYLRLYPDASLVSNP